MLVKIEIGVYVNSYIRGQHHHTSLFAVHQKLKDKTLWSVHFGVVVVELINCKCGGIVSYKI